MEEFILWSFINDPESWKSYRRYVDKDTFSDDNPHVCDVLKAIDDLYEHGEAVSLDTVRLWCYTHININNKNKVYYDTIFNNIYNIGININNTNSTESTIGLLNKIKEKNIIKYILEEVYNEYNSKELSLSSLITKIDSLCSSYKDSKNLSVSEEIDQFFLDTHWSSVKSIIYDGSGIKFKLKTLRIMTGCLRRGDFGFIFARPEVGKTSFLADNGCFVMEQIDGNYLHINNEEEGNKVITRYHQAALGKTNEQLYNMEVAEVETLFDNATQGKFKFLNKTTLYRKDVEAACERVKPRFIIIDSIDKVKGFGERQIRDDLHYKEIYQWARDLSNTYGPVVGTCHASVDAEGREWLTMDHVAYAKTAKQGEADWILGIGQSHKSNKESFRYLHLSKNKLIGDQEIKEEHRHGQFAVRFYPEISQYEDYHSWD